MSDGGAAKLLIESLPVRVDLKRVLSAQGVPAREQGRLNERITRHYESVIADVLARAAPKAAASLAPVCVSAGSLRAGEVDLRAGEQVCGRLTGVEAACFMVCTLGGELDQYLAGLLSHDVPSAWIADTAASYAISGACRVATSEAARLLGWTNAVERASPGNDGWDLRDQRLVVDLAGGDTIGVSALDEGVLRPSKSLTVMLYPRAASGASSSCHESRCDRCPRRDLCTFRFSDG